MLVTCESTYSIFTLHCKHAEILACHNLMDASGRHKTPRSETKDFITPRNYELCVCMSSFWLLSAMGVTWGWAQVDAAYTLGLQQTWVTLGLGNLNLLKGLQANCSNFVPEGGIIFTTLASRQTYPCLRKRPSLSSKTVCCTDILEQIVWKKSCWCLYPQDMKYKYETHGKLPPNNITIKMYTYKDHGFLLFPVQ